MENKLLTIGSITACVVLVLAGLSPVVGFDNVRYSMKDSPLFTIRTKRAIDKDTDSLISNYVGKGNIFLIPKRNTKTWFMLKYLDQITKLNKETYEHFIQFTEKQFHSVPHIQSDDLPKMIKILDNLKKGAIVVNTIPPYEKAYENLLNNKIGFTCIDTYFPEGCYLIALYLLFIYIMGRIITMIQNCL